MGNKFLNAPVKKKILLFITATFIVLTGYQNCAKAPFVGRTLSSAVSNMASLACNPTDPVCVSPCAVNMYYNSSKGKCESEYFKVTALHNNSNTFSVASGNVYKLRVDMSPNLTFQKAEPLVRSAIRTALNQSCVATQIDSIIANPQSPEIKTWDSDFNYTVTLANQMVGCMWSSKIFAKRKDGMVVTSQIYIDAPALCDNGMAAPACTSCLPGYEISPITKKCVLSTCANGATNIPTCDACPSAKPNYIGSPQNTCVTCPAGSTYNMNAKSCVCSEATKSYNRTTNMCDIVSPPITQCPMGTHAVGSSCAPNCTPNSTIDTGCPAVPNGTFARACMASGDYSEMCTLTCATGFQKTSNGMFCEAIVTTPTTPNDPTNPSLPRIPVATAPTYPNGGGACNPYPTNVYPACAGGCGPCPASGTIPAQPSTWAYSGQGKSGGCNAGYTRRDVQFNQYGGTIKFICDANLPIATPPNTQSGGGACTVYPVNEFPNCLGGCGPCPASADQPARPSTWKFSGQGIETGCNPGYNVRVLESNIGGTTKYACEAGLPIAVPPNTTYGGGACTVYPVNEYPNCYGGCGPCPASADQPARPSTWVYSGQGNSSASGCNSGFHMVTIESNIGGPTKYSCEINTRPTSPCESETQLQIQANPCY